MITTDLTGNLGNHLFQYALCRTIAEKRGFEWGVNPIPYGDYYNGTPQMNFLNIHYGKQIEGIQREHIEQRIHISNTPGGADWWQYEPNLIDELEDNTKITGAWQTEKYFLNNKEKIKEWYTVKEEPNISNLINDNTCVINIRGGEYKGFQELILSPSYFRNAMEIVKRFNSKVEFIVITDDIPFAKSQLGLPTFHFSIAVDWYIINKAKWLIISNSSFAWFPSWLNDECNMIIAPKYWGRHNVSDGYWASSDIFTKGWMYLSKEGKLYNYNEVIEEIEKSKYASLKGKEL